MKQINKLLVANRGEIAVRIFRTLNRMGIATVAVYSEADRDSLHVQHADERYLLQGNSLSDTYLNIEQIIAIARECEADAIHPGYGFLSENPLFARAVEETGMIFAGPTAEAIALMGNKKEARVLAVSLGIPVIEGAVGSAEELAEKAGEMGYPVMIKAAAGGGGKGMRIAWSEKEFRELLESTQREAKNYFGNSEVYIEKYLADPRHIEIQLLADHDGNIVTLYERECSMQRRHQKIIEEAPAPNVSASLRNNLCEAAIKLAGKIGYRNAGTIEFLVKEDQFYFLEMNTRIQVEHPVSEMITGIDIVREQIMIAMGKPLSFTQNDIKISGHAIEARIYAEDPANGFLPSPGKVHFHKPPSGKGVRVETALSENGEISAMFDPMVSKLIVHGTTRETARKKLVKSLRHYVLLGIRTNIPFLIDLAGTSEFVEGKSNTNLVEHLQQNRKNVQPHIPDKELLAMAFLFAKPVKKETGNSTWQNIGYWRLLPDAHLLINREPLTHHYFYHNPHHLSVQKNNIHKDYRLVERTDDSLRIDVSGNIHTLYYHARNGEVFFHHEGVTAVVSHARYLGRETLRAINENPVLEGDSIVRAPMHGTVVKISVKEGESVAKGDTLLVLESMKMENKITATVMAYVKQIEVNQGDIIENDAPMIILTDKIVH